jgi:outer membrane protein TolC
MAVQLPAHGEVQARAQDADPLVRESVAMARAQRLQTGAISANDRPNVFLTGALSGRAGGAPATNGVTPDGGGWLPDVPNYSAAVVLEWPLLDPVNRARVSASKHHEQALRANIDVNRQLAATRAEQSYRNAEAALQALDALVRAAEAARANHEQAEARFRSGLGTSTELADAEMLRIDAEIQLAIGKFQIAVERAKLARIMTEEP